MTRAGKTMFGTARAIACLIFLGAGLTTLGQFVAVPDAEAQSSVRPPAGAVQNATPQPSLPRSTVPTFAPRPTQIEKGNVPGGSLGNNSDTEIWRAVRKGISGTVSIPDKKAGQLVQSDGEAWRVLRNGPLTQWGVIGIFAIVLLLLLFFLGRGRIQIEHGQSGETMTRFVGFERMAHWLLAVSFIILAFTGLNVTFGKHVWPELIGKESFAAIAETGKWLHNYVGFAFMVGLALVFLVWIKDNFPNIHDIKWMAKGGGLFTEGVHPPSKKFNAGQKLIFWLVILGGLLLSLSGLALMFPFQAPLFAEMFVYLNKLGFDFPTVLTPIQEMQYATLWHAIVALGLIVVVIAHIYIGTVGMEGAFDAMGTGEVDVNWAKEHHSIWAGKVLAVKSKSGGGDKAEVAPAE